MASIFSCARRSLRAIIFLTIISFCVLISGCSTVSSDASSQKTGFYFDTVVTLTAFDKDFVSEDSSFFTKNEDAKEGCLSFLDECLMECSHYENLFSSKIEGSDTWNINCSKGALTEIDFSTYELLKKALYYAELTDGLFDPTIGTVTELWDFHADSDKQLPESGTLNTALSHVDYNKVELSEKNGKYYAHLLDPEAKLDLGGIAKGYIADKLKEFYLEKGVKNGIINLGGNVLLIGGKPDNDAPFNVGVQKPFGEASEVSVTLSLKDKSLVTSGVYDRYFESDGKLYHHILDTHTGFPVQNNILSTTIVSDSSADGDALSTICFSLGIEKGMELIESIPDTYVLYITDNYEIVYSDGFPGFAP